MTSDKSPFNWRRTTVEDESGGLRQLEKLIKNEEFEEARALLDNLIPNDDDKFKISQIRRMENIVQNCDVDQQLRDEDYNFVTFGGTDPKPYFDLDKKLLLGTATLVEKKELYIFWSAYPKHKSDSYCTNMFEWLIENNVRGSSELANHIIGKIKTPSVSCFYFLLAADLGFFDEVQYIVDNIGDHFSPQVILLAKIEYSKYKKTRKIPEVFSLANNLDFE